MKLNAFIKDLQNLIKCEEKKGSVRDLGDDGGPNKTSPPGPLHRFHLD